MKDKDESAVAGKSCDHACFDELTDKKPHRVLVVGTPRGRSNVVEQMWKESEPLTREEFMAARDELAEKTGWDLTRPEDIRGARFQTESGERIEILEIDPPSEHPDMDELMRQVKIRAEDYANGEADKPRGYDHTAFTKPKKGRKR